MSDAPFGELAHELRGSLGVIRGAVEELEGDAMMKQLALRGTHQLEHLAEAWRLIGDPEPQLVDASLREAVEAAAEHFAALEPRRAKQVELALGDDARVGAIDRERVRVGFARLFSHAVRASRETVRVELLEDGVALHGAIDADPIDDPALWQRSSRLAAAVGVLAPITARWDTSSDALVWRAK